MKGINNPTVSVLMPVYNAEKYLEEAIKSILSQSYTNFELIIINDGSKDNSKKIIQSYAKQDNRVRVINQTNHGLVYSLNKGIDIANGTYIARQDGDDISLPTRFQEQIEYFKNHPRIALLGTAFTAVDESGKDIYTFNTITNPEAIKLDMIVRNPFGHGTTMYKKSVIQRLGGYAKISYSEDYELWSRVVEQSEASNLPKVLYKWRLVESSMSHSKHFANQELIVQLKQNIWEQSLPIERISKLVDQTLKLIKRRNTPNQYLVENMLVALTYYLTEKGQNKLAARINKNLLLQHPIKSTKLFLQAQRNQVIEGYDIRRIRSDARGETYDL